MRTKAKDPATLKEHMEALLEAGMSREEAAKKLGYTTYRAAWKRLQSAKLTLSEQLVDIEPLPPVDNIDELLARRKQQFTQKDAHEKARKLINVRVRDSGAIGILHLGDPHVDDDGTDIGLLEEHMGLVQKTEGLYCANVGDTTNNWIGRLARLYAQQSTTADQAWMLAEWLFKSGKGKWIYVIGGNHDAWSGSGDPLKWIARQTNALYQSSECRINLLIPSAPCGIRINARHDFSGHSMWNPAHGPASASIKGVRDHIAICGHKHTSGYNILKCPETGLITHALIVAGYKTYDRFAMEKGFRDQRISPAVLTVIDHKAKTPAGLVTVFHDIEYGIDVLKMRRKKK
jgi:hypothetical protein